MKKFIKLVLILIILTVLVVCKKDISEYTHKFNTKETDHIINIINENSGYIEENFINNKKIFKDNNKNNKILFDFFKNEIIKGSEEIDIQQIKEVANQFKIFGNNPEIYDSFKGIYSYKINGFRFTILYSLDYYFLVEFSDNIPSNNNDILIFPDFLDKIISKNDLYNLLKNDRIAEIKYEKGKIKSILLCYYL